MGAESPRSFSTIIEAKRAEFLSYSDAMRTLMELTGDSLADIAVALKQHRIHKSHVAYISGPEQAVTKAENTDALEALLDETIRSGRIVPVHYQCEDEAAMLEADAAMLEGEADMLEGEAAMFGVKTAMPDSDGWLHREFIFAMGKARLPWPVTPDILAAVEARRAKLESGSESPPEWTRPYIGRNRISLRDAAALLAHVDSSAPGFLGDDEVGCIDSWRDALIDAIDSREIEASTWNTHEARDREQMLSHADIRTWCASRAHNWPIPDPSPQPTTNADALAEIERLRAEISRLKTELAEDERGANTKEHERYAPELEIATIAWGAAVTGWRDSNDAPTPTEFIKKWLRSHYPELANDAITRVATVANWDKRRGRKPGKSSST